MQVTDNNEVPMATEEPEPISNEENTNKIETQEKNVLWIYVGKWLKPFNNYFVF